MASIKSALRPWVTEMPPGEKQDSLEKPITNISALNQSNVFGKVILLIKIISANCSFKISYC
jgi:hypothetical protein